MWDIPIDSRITFPPPKIISLPLCFGPPLQSASTSTVRAVSARRTRSLVVGPYRVAYSARFSMLLAAEFSGELADLLFDGVVWLLLTGASPRAVP